MNLILLHQVVHSCSRADDWQEDHAHKWEKEAFSYPVETLDDLKQIDGLTKIQANLRYAANAVRNYLPLFNAVLEDLGNNGKMAFSVSSEPELPTLKISISEIDRAYVSLSAANDHLKQAALFCASEGMMGPSALSMKLWEETLTPLLYVTDTAIKMSHIKGNVLALPRTEASP